MDVFERYILLGYSGHGAVVAEAALACGWNLLGYADRLPVVRDALGLRYLGDERSADFEGWTPKTAFLLGIGDNSARIRAAAFVRDNGYECATVTHPDSSVSKWCQVGAGTFIARGACVNPLATIGMDVVLNTGCSVDHDCMIGNGAHVAPNAVLAGGVTIGMGAFIGANAVIKEGIHIGDGAVVGAGAVVIRDVPPGHTVVGNPAKFIRR